MQTAKSALCLVLCASLAAPASAQMRAAAALAESGASRAGVVAPLTASAATLSPVLNALAPVPTLSAAPSAAPGANTVRPLALPAPQERLLLPAPSIPAPAGATPSGNPAAPGQAAAPSANAPAARESAAAPAAVAAERTESESFWSGARRHAGESVAVAAGLAGAGLTAAALVRTVARAPHAPLAAAGAALPTAAGVHALAFHALAFLGAGGVLAGAYAANRWLRVLATDYAAKKKLSPQMAATVRLASSVVLWTGAGALALLVGGAPHAFIAGALGAGGTVLTLTLRDVLGNIVQGAYFLITRPYSIGARIQIDDQVGVLSDVTLTSVIVRKDDGSTMTIRHSALAGKAIVVLAAQTAPNSHRRFSQEKFAGIPAALWKTVVLNRGLWIAAAAFAVSLAAAAVAPALISAALATTALSAASFGWIMSAVHWSFALASAAGTLWLGQRVEKALQAAVAALAARNGWSKETSAIVRLVVNALVWTLAGGFALLRVGMSWATLSTTALVTLGVGLAANSFFSSILQGITFLITRPYSIGARVQIDDQVGTVSDLNLSYVSVRKDDGSEVQIRHATLAGKTVVVSGAYQLPNSRPRFSISSRRKFQGAFAAVFRTLALNKNLWLSAAAVAGLLLAPTAFPALAAGWAVIAVRMALVPAILWLARNLEKSLTAAADKLAESNAWSKETKAIVRFVTSAAVWLTAASVALLHAGISWTALGAGGLTTLLFGLVTNNYFGSVVEGGELLFSKPKPFKIGDRVKIAAFTGTVADMTLYHVVLTLDDGRHALVPYAVVRDELPVVLNHSNPAQPATQTH